MTLSPFSWLIIATVASWVLSVVTVGPPGKSQFSDGLSLVALVLTAISIVWWLTGSP